MVCARDKEGRRQELVVSNCETPAVFQTILLIFTVATHRGFAWCWFRWCAERCYYLTMSAENFWPWICIEW